jgi:hypothetical protein
MNLTQIGIGAILSSALCGTLWWGFVALELLTQTCGG